MTRTKSNLFLEIRAETWARDLCGGFAIIIISTPFIRAIWISQRKGAQPTQSYQILLEVKTPQWKRSALGAELITFRACIFNYCYNPSLECSSTCRFSDSLVLLSKAPIGRHIQINWISPFLSNHRITVLANPIYFKSSPSRDPDLTQIAWGFFFLLLLSGMCVVLDDGNYDDGDDVPPHGTNFTTEDLLCLSCFLVTLIHLLKEKKKVGYVFWPFYANQSEKVFNSKQLRHICINKKKTHTWGFHIAPLSCFSCLSTTFFQ